MAIIILVTLRVHSLLQSPDVSEHLLSTSLGSALPVVHGMKPLPRKFTVAGAYGVWGWWKALGGSGVNNLRQTLTGEQAGEPGAQQSPQISRQE